MLGKQELQKIARSRLAEAKILRQRRRFDGAVYLCGYAIEIGFKCRIADKITQWRGFPETDAEFSLTNKAKTHDLVVLRKLAELEDDFRNDATLAKAWSDIGTWTSDIRYKPIGAATDVDADNVINAAEVILRHLRILRRGPVAPNPSVPTSPPAIP